MELGTTDLNVLLIQKLVKHEYRSPHMYKKQSHTNILQCVIYNLTTVSPVYSQDFVVHQRADSLIFLVYSKTDPVLSGVRGLISELKPEQHNLHM